jgi:hypothetical protein
MIITSTGNSLYRLLSKTYHATVDSLDAAVKLLEDFEPYMSSLSQEDKDCVEQHLHGLRQAASQIRNSKP